MLKFISLSTAKTKSCNIKMAENTELLVIIKVCATTHMLPHDECNI